MVTSFTRNLVNQKIGSCMILFRPALSNRNITQPVYISYNFLVAASWKGRKETVKINSVTYFISLTMPENCPLCELETTRASVQTYHLHSPAAYWSPSLADSTTEIGFASACPIYVLHKLLQNNPNYSSFSKENIAMPPPADPFSRFLLLFR